MNDLVGGHVDFFCEQAVSVAEQVDVRHDQGLCGLGAERLAALPDVPSAKEAGIDYQMSIWAGIFAPKGTPKAVVAQARRRARQGARRRPVKRRIADLGGSMPENSERSPAAFDAYVNSEIARWAPVLKAAAEPAK